MGFYLKNMDNNSLLRNWITAFYLIIIIVIIMKSVKMALSYVPLFSWDRSFQTLCYPEIKQIKLNQIKSNQTWSKVMKGLWKQNFVFFFQRNNWKRGPKKSAPHPSP